MRKYLLSALILLLIIIIIVLIICNKNTIVGKWKAIDSRHEYYYIFNKDKTCSYEMANAKLGCTYKINKKVLTILYNGNTKESNFEYHLEKDTLIIKDDAGIDNKFIRQKIK